MGKTESSERLVSETEDQGKPNMRQNANKLHMYLCCGVVLLGSVSVGTMLGLSSPLIPDIQKDESKLAPRLTVSQASWFGAFVTLGGMVGGVLSGFIMQGIGRKLSSILSAIPYIIGLLFISLASEVWMLYVGRIITGLGVGMSSLVVPVYIGEVATAELRGMLGSGTQLCIVTGILLIYGLGTFLHWRALCGIAVIPPGLLMVLSYFIQETPRFLMMKKKPETARKSLQKLRGAQADIEEEYCGLERSLKEEANSASWIDIIKDRSMRTPTILSLVSMYFQQISGINCVMFYAKTLFMEAGFTSHSQLTLALLSIAGAQVIFTFVSCVIIDKTGRKILLIVGAVFMTLSLTAFGIYFQLQNAHSSYVNEMTLANFEMINFTTTHASTNHHVPALTWLALISMVVFIAAYSIGIGPIAWLLIGEIIPVRARGNSAGLATGFNLFLVFILTLQFSDMMQIMTPQGTFWFFAANCALSIVFTVVWIPETKGKSLEEIDMYFKS